MHTSHRESGLLSTSSSSPTCTATGGFAGATSAWARRHLGSATGGSAADARATCAANALSGLGGLGANTGLVRASKGLHLHLAVGIAQPPHRIGTDLIQPRVVSVDGADAIVQQRVASIEGAAGRQARLR